MNYGKRWLEKNGHPSGRVFEIINTRTGDIYIGHTVVPIKKRLYQAIASANKGIKGLLHDSIRKYGKECFIVNMLHECAYDEDVKIIEDKFIKDKRPTLNAEKGNKEIIVEIINVVTGDNYICATSLSLEKKLVQMCIAAKAGKQGMIYDDIRSWGEECYEIKYIQDCNSKNEELRLVYELNPSLNENKEEWFTI